ncbi:MAG: protein TolR [Chromatiales bacterium]|nr:protein TolR [Chromatiales bacterium]
MARAYNKRRLMGEINVVPYIDVMLVLLIIFMVTAPLLTQGIEVDLPKVGAAPLDADKFMKSEPLVLSVDSGGNLYLNIGSGKDKPMAGEEIVKRTAAVLSRDPKTPVLIKADQSVSHGVVVAAMRLLQDGGAPNVGIMTDPESEIPVRKQ